MNLFFQVQFHTPLRFRPFFRSLCGFLGFYCIIIRVFRGHFCNRTGSFFALFFNSVRVIWVRKHIILKIKLLWCGWFLYMAAFVFLLQRRGKFVILTITILHLLGIILLVTGLYTTLMNFFLAASKSLLLKIGKII